MLLFCHLSFSVVFVVVGGGGSGGGSCLKIIYLEVKVKRTVRSKPRNIKM